MNLVCISFRLVSSAVISFNLMSEHFWNLAETLSGWILRNPPERWEAAAVLNERVASFNTSDFVQQSTKADWSGIARGFLHRRPLSVNWEKRVWACLTLIYVPSATCRWEPKLLPDPLGMSQSCPALWFMSLLHEQNTPEAVWAGRAFVLLTDQPRHGGLLPHPVQLVHAGESAAGRPRPQPAARGPAGPAEWPLLPRKLQHTGGGWEEPKELHITNITKKTQQCRI